MFGIDTLALDGALAAAVAAAQAALITFIKTTLPTIMMGMLKSLFIDLLKDVLLKKIFLTLLATYFMKQLIILVLCILCSFLADILIDGLIKSLSILAFSEQLLQLPAVTNALSVTTILAESLLGLFAVLSAFKVFFAYFGFESDEPAKLFWKIGFGTLAVFGAPSICGLLIKISTSIVNVVWSMILTTQTVFDGSIPDVLKSNLKNAIYPTGISNPLDLVTVQLDLLLFFVFAFKLVELLIKFAQRYVLMLMLIIVSPIAFAAGAVSFTKKYFTGWMNLFLGNLLIQILQVAVIAIMFAYPAYNTDTAFDKIIFYLIILGCLEILMRVPTVVANLGLSGGSTLKSRILFEASDKLKEGTGFIADQMGNAWKNLNKGKGNESDSDKKGTVRIID